MGQTFDVIVAGLGAVGSAAVYHLARRGQQVLGLDRFGPPHTQGSSHGGSRIIRRAYFEGAHYLPLLDRAYACWRDLEAVTGRALLHKTGGLTIGPPAGDVVAGARRCADRYRLDHEVLSAEEAQTRFPAFHLLENQIAVWEPEAGYLVPEHCIEAHLDTARRHGATFGFDEPVLGWEVDGEGVQVTTTQATYRAGRLVLCAGGWMPSLLADLEVPLHIERQVNVWFRPQAHPERLAPAHCPVYIWDLGDDAALYGFPDLGAGVKAGLHHQGHVVDHPDAVDRTVHAADIDALRTALRRLLPDADGPVAQAAVCFYTNTPDRDYLIARHPAHPQVLLASACSGHGFKASSAVGEMLADLATDRAPSVDVSAFRWRW